MRSHATAAAPDGGRDFVGIAKAYARRAIAKRNRRRFGIWIRLAAQRFLTDLERAAKRDAPFDFDEWHAIDVCDFAEKLPHVEGRWFNADGSPQPTIVLHDAQVFFLVNLFGFRALDGTRRFTTALLAMARKNAKSTIAAIVGLYCLTCEAEIGPQVYSAATTGSQARIVFKVAKQMAERTADLRSAFSLGVFASAIADYQNGGSFKPINAKASTQDGLNPSCTILDELHAHKTHDLLSVLKSAAGARAQPLFLYLTTEGYSSPGPWAEEREFAKKVLRGIVRPEDSDFYLALYFAVDEADEELGTQEDDDFDEEAWHKANPLLDSNAKLLNEIRKLAVEAKEKPGTHAEFKIKRLNRPSSVARGWINLTKWRACRGEVALEELRPLKCWGGLDLSMTTDLTSFRLVWPLPGGGFATKGWRWVPREAVRQRTLRGLIPYAGWVLGGVLLEAGDEAIDYGPIEECIIEASEQFNLQWVNYDGWNATQSAQRLVAADIDMRKCVQGPKTYNPAMQALEVAYLNGQLAHGNDPVLNWNASNIVARRDVNMNMAPDKRRSTERIDDMVALLMGVEGAVQQGAPAPEYQVFFAG
jgi:phage terminase large subunit-like protein